MKVKNLLVPNPERQEDEILDYWALYRGGRELKARLSRFITRAPNEPPEVYTRRLADAHYRNYAANITNNFLALLFAAPMTLALSTPTGESTEPDEWYQGWRKDVDGTGKNDTTFYREQFARSLTKGKAYWTLEPRNTGGEVATENLKDWREANGDLSLRSFEAEAAVDWLRDSTGQLIWILFYEEESIRLSINDATRTIVHRWRLYDRTALTIYEYHRKSDEQFKEDAEVAPQVYPYAVDIGRVPVIEMAPPEGLWLMDHMASPQREHFSISCAKNYQMRKVCFAMPVFHIVDKDDPPKVGMGHAWYCGIDEKLDWAAPPTDVLTFMQSEEATLKDEIYRITSQMAAGVDNNAAAVGRSGESKQQDQDGTFLILSSYGTSVREAAEATMKMAAAMRQEPELPWTVGGLDITQQLTTQELLDLLKEAQMVNMGSNTFEQELRKLLLARTLKGVEPSKQLAARQEVEAFDFVGAKEDAADAALKAKSKPAPQV